MNHVFSVGGFPEIKESQPTRWAAAGMRSAWLCDASRLPAIFWAMLGSEANPHPRISAVSSPTTFASIPTTSGAILNAGRFAAITGACPQKGAQEGEPWLFAHCRRGLKEVRLDYDTG